VHRCDLPIAGGEVAIPISAAEFPWIETMLFIQYSVEFTDYLYVNYNIVRFRTRTSEERDFKGNKKSDAADLSIGLCYQIFRYKSPILSVWFRLKKKTGIEILGDDTEVRALVAVED
jgi:hypothetical protein